MWRQGLRDTARLWWRTLRCTLRPIRSALLWSGLVLAASLLPGIAPPAATQKKPLAIGVLALGPRYVPAWTCRRADYQPGVAETRHETMPSYVLGLLSELDKLGYVEDRKENAGKPGTRFVLDLRSGTLPELRAAAHDFVAGKKVDVILAVATATVRIAQEETRGSSIPILMASVSEPVKEGFVASLARPGGNITGVSHQLLQGSGKRVELFKEMLPGLKRILTVRMPNYSVSEKSLVEMRAAADRLGIEIIDWTVASREELQTRLAGLRSDMVDGIIMAPDSLAISNADLLAETSLARGIAIFGNMAHMGDLNMLAAYGPSTYHAGERVARYLDKIHNGAKPGDLPVEALDPMLVINLKAAECLGITPPFELLRQADRVIR